jgi:hypothetical protein
MVLAYVSYWCTDKQLHQQGALEDHFGAKTKVNEIRKQVNH